MTQPSLAAELARTRELLRVLYDIASDLAAISDVEAVLLAIVQRTRAVTGADMAYVSLNDHDSGLTWIRKSDGVRTQAYRNIRMPLGTGVLGKAATGLTMVSTTDYAHDPGLVHLEDIDAIVAGEGVRSILGVPMNVHGRVSGALLIADRREVAYPGEVVEMVDAIARQAAVAIDYSARLTRVTNTVAELGAQQDAGQRRVRALQELLDLDRRLAEALVSADGAESIRSLVETLFASRVDLLSPGVPDSAALDRAARSAAAAGRPVPVRLPDEEVTVVPALVGTEHLASLVVHTHVPADQRDLLEHAGLYLGISLMLANVRRAAEERSQYELLDDFISERELPRNLLESRLAQLGLDPRGQLAMLVAQTDGAKPELERQLRKLVPKPLLVAVHGQHVCVLHQGKPCGRSLDEKLRAQQITARMGAAAVRGGVEGVPAAHCLAELGLATAEAMGLGLVDGDGIGALGALIEADAAGRLPGGLTRPAQPLVDYDESRGTELVRTAWALLEFGPQAPAVADRLFIHPNTLRQRTARITSLLGEGWQSGPGRLDLHLALRALVLRSTES